MTIGSKAPAVDHAFPSEWQRLVVEPIWWQAVEVRTEPERIVLPWEDSARAAEEERRYRASRP